MTEQEYLNKLKRLDINTKKHFDEIFVKIYPHFCKLSYSQLELLTEHIKRMGAKDSIIISQLWEKGKEPKV
ncbi:hypothetical protein [Flavobacterium sp. 140616W15]|uniref:hypothetical protein n=1 Tax=Flavobacterium sp. 140616W15 TaxID=2478552 RepID=UPI000F0C7A0C|nr:hypothetical protein [Flavobacterium sp. 140616W15]AYN04783.1 hypothetical protein EAG11_11880 [Flavobacterium sp. 140616W15]